MPHDSLSQSPRAKKPGLQGLNTWTWWMLSSMDIITNHHNKPQNHRVVERDTFSLSLSTVLLPNEIIKHCGEGSKMNQVKIVWEKVAKEVSQWKYEKHTLHSLSTTQTFKFKSACEGEEVQRYISLKGVSLNVRGLFYKAGSWSLALINTDQVWCSWQTALLHLLSLSSSFFNKLETYRF